jgi:CubicO group peptidase (beta-lactamase class C family)
MTDPISPHRRDLLGASLAAPLVGAAKASHSPIAGFIRERMAAKGIPGAAVTVVSGGRLRIREAFGKSSLELGVPATTHTVFPLASSSKMVAALTAAALHEGGKLDFEASVRAYLPELPERFDPVRIRQMMSHTSGLGSLEDVPEFSVEHARRAKEEAYAGDLRLDFFTDEELLVWAGRVPFKSQPGERWRYNQLPYFVLGQVLARLGGMAYPRLAQARVLEPLGMTSAAYGDHRTVVPGRPPTNYTRQFGPLQNFALTYTPAFWPAAGLNASALDMTGFLGGLRPGRLLNTETLALLWAPTRLNEGRIVKYGLGFALDGEGDDFSAGHEGGGCSYVRWWPRRELGVAVQLNLSGSKEDDIDLKVAGLAQGKPAPR